MSNKLYFPMWIYLLSILFIPVVLFGQANFSWPVEPLFQNHYISGNFCEYRSTSASGHYHNGTDIPKADGSPVYAVEAGVVSYIDPNTSNAYVRVQDKAYVHIVPNPSLSVGDPVVAAQTILGTIYPGMGHVHFTNGYVGSEKNSMLYSNSFTPFEDTWAPIIRFVSFFQNNTTNQFPTNQLSGLVDIVVKVDEQNAPPGVGSAYSNNGTYKIGYKILAADSSTIVYEPPNGGVRFQFDTKPSSNVNIAYFQSLSSTTSHVYQVTNNISSDNYWDTRTLPVDDYVVLVFTEDSRQNTDTAYVRVQIVEQDITPPAQPVLKYVKGTSTGMELGWYPNSDPDLMGYRLYFSFDNVNWSLYKDESVLTSAVTDTFINTVINNNAIYFRLTAVDNAPLPNESDPSDFYGVASGTSFFHRVLLVDGFDRIDGEWPVPYHYFAYTHGHPLKENLYSFDTVPNEAVEQSLIDLNDYESVFWILGDESVQDETFSDTEQAVIETYLENGGYLFVSGSDIARDLDPNGNPAATPQDELFLHEYLKINFESRAEVAHNLTGLSGSLFDGLNLQYGYFPYSLDTVDVISPWGSIVWSTLEYSSNHLAGIQYAGSFGGSAVGGKLVLCAFPFETISDEEIRIDFMGRVLNFFFPTVGIDRDQNSLLPTDYALHPNFPNPFNPETKISYQLPQASRVELKIYNTLGQHVRNLVTKQLEAGSHQVTWDGCNDLGEQLASGIYIAVFSARSIHSNQHYKGTHKLLLTK